MKFFKIFGEITARIFQALADLVMKFIHAIGALVVLGCAIYVSFGHSIDLFENGAGWPREDALVIVVAVEVVFAMSAAVIMHHRMKGIRPPAYTVCGGVFGVIVVTWGNVRVSLDHGIEGILLGLAVPISVVLAEGIFAEAVRRNKQPADNSTNQAPAVPAEQPAEIEEESTNTPVERSTDLQPIWKVGDRPAMDREPTTVMTETSQEPAEEKENPAIQPVEEEISATSNQPQVVDKKEVQPTNHKPLVDKAAENNQPPEVAENPAADPVVEITKVAEDQPVKKAAETETAKPNLTIVPARPKAVEKVADKELMEMAEKLYQKNGETLTERGFARYANISRYKAGRILKQLSSCYDQGTNYGV